MNVTMAPAEQSRSSQRLQDRRQGGFELVLKPRDGGYYDRRNPSNENSPSSGCPALATEERPPLKEKEDEDGQKAQANAKALPPSSPKGKETEDKEPPSPTSPSSPPSSPRPSPPPSPRPPPPAPPAPPSIQVMTVIVTQTHTPSIITATSTTTQPNIAIVAPQVTSTSLPQPSTTSLSSRTPSSLTPSQILIPSLLPSAVAPASFLTSATARFAPGETPEPGQGGRKGVDPFQKSNSPTTTVFTLAAAAETAAPTNLPLLNEEHPHISDSAERALITAGTIGGLIVVGFVVFLLMRFTNWEGYMHYRKRQRESQRFAEGFAEGKRISSDSFPEGGEKPPVYSMSAPQYSPQPPRAIATVTELDRMEAERQVDRRDMSSPAATPVKEALPFMSNRSPIEPQLYNPRVSAQRVSPNPYTLASDPEPYGVAPRIQAPSVSRYRSNRDSELSSLSSGFGDGLVLESSETGPYRALHPARKIPENQYSARGTQGSDTYQSANLPIMMEANAAGSNRDTIYTTTSEESRPRFRTVQSWVGQQSRNVIREREEQQRELANMPDYRDTRTTSFPSENQYHQRNISEVTNPAFTAHPGDEIYVPKHERVPSAILDRNLGR